jgi:hypothetical protein
MHAIAEWSIVDTSMSIVFVTLLGNNPGPAAAIYASIGSGAKKAAFGAIAESSITDLTVLDLFGAISKRYASLADERHRLAHWVWGHASYIPDGVLLCDPRTIMGNELEWKVFNEAIKRGEKINQPPPPSSMDKILVYEESDFARLSKCFSEFNSHIKAFNSLLSLQSRTDGKARLRVDQLRQKLLNVPEFGKVVDQLRRDRKNKQAAQKSRPPKRPPS